MESAPPELFRMNRMRYVATMLLGPLVAFAAWVFLFAAADELLRSAPETLALVIILISLCLGAAALYCIVESLHLILVHPVALEVTEDGFYIAARSRSLGRVKWDQIWAARVEGAAWDRRLVVSMLQASSHGIGGRPVVVVRQFDLPIPVEDLERRIQMHLPDFGSMATAPTRPKLPWKKY